MSVRVIRAGGPIRLGAGGRRCYLPPVPPLIGVGNLAAGTPTVTTIPLTWTAASGGIGTLTYGADYSTDGGTTWITNSGTFASTGGAEIGLTGGSTVYVRAWARDQAGQVKYTYFPGPITLATVTWTNGLNSTRYDILLARSSAAPGSAVSGSLVPNGLWQGGTATLTPSNGDAAIVVTLPTSGAAPVSFSYTPSAAGEIILTGTNTAGLQNPRPAPLTCFAAAAGTAQAITLTAAFTDPNGGRVLNLRGYQKNTPSGTPNGFSAVAGAVFGFGWGEYWISIASLAGATSGLFARLYDARSSGASSSVGTGTRIQDTVQVYGAVSTTGIKRLLLPASNKPYYLEIATDAAFTNPVRIPSVFYIRNVLAVMVRSQESNLLCSWSHGGPPGTGFVSYANGNTLSSYSSGSDTSTSEAAFANSWAPVDGTTSISVHGGVANSVAMMELGRLFEAQFGDGISLAGVYVMDGGSGATFAGMVGSDGTPCGGFQQAVVNQLGGQFRYLHFTTNDGGGTLSYGKAGTVAALQGMVSFLSAHYPAWALASFGFWSGVGSSAEAAGCATAGTAVRYQLEAGDPRVVAGDANQDWFGFGGYDHGHPSWASEGRIARGAFRMLLAAEIPAWGGLGRSPADRYTQLHGTGTMVANSGVVEVALDLAAGASNVSAVTWTMAGGDSDPIDPASYTALTSGQYRGWIHLYAGAGRPGDGSQEILFTGGQIANGKLRLTIDTSGGTGTVKYADNSTGPEPASMLLHFWCNPNLGPNFPDYGLPMLFDDRTNTGVDGIPYGWPVPPRTDIAIARV